MSTSISLPPVKTDEVLETDHFSAYDDSGLRYCVVERMRVTRVRSGNEFIRMTPGERWYQTTSGALVRKRTDAEFEICTTGAKLKRD